MSIAVNSVPRSAATTLVLCFCTAVIEGIDLQSMGIAAPKLGPQFQLSKEALGYVLAASPIGLFFGAFIGGRVADLWGRKGALLLAIVTFGIFQLATAATSHYASLVAIRFLCGLGLGGAFPNLIALTAEASGGRNSILNVVITAAGMPTGGTLASVIGLFGAAGGNWRIVFYVGGIAPLVLAPIMAAALQESQLYREAKAAAILADRHASVLSVLFGQGRANATLLLWIGFFFTTVVTYLLLNWLPVLMVARGFSKADAFVIQILFNIGAAGGSILLGWRMQLRPSRILLIACYAGVTASLLAIVSFGRDLLAVSAAAATVGAFLLGAQYILYGLSPAFYRIETRGTGTGAAVAAGRLGSAAGPYLAGLLLGAGASGSHVLQALLPVTAVAAAAAVLLLIIQPPVRPLLPQAQEKV